LQLRAKAAEDPIVLRSTIRGRDVAVLAAWLAFLAGFVALAAAAYSQHPLPFDVRITLWTQDLGLVPGAAPLFEFANVAGDGTRLVMLAGVLVACLLLFRLRFEALVVAGVVAMRGLQVAIRHTIEWPAGQAEYFYTTRTLPDGGSFPSGHVLGEVLLYGLLFWFAPRLFSSRIVVIAVRAFCGLVMVLGGPARLYAGAHWPSDVAGSMLLAALYLLPVWWLDVRRRARTENPTLGPFPAREGVVTYTSTISRPAASTFGTSERSPTTSV
jgi:undecaprenyl-diphosphatase